MQRCRVLVRVAEVNRGPHHIEGPRFFAFLISQCSLVHSLTSIPWGTSIGRILVGATLSVLTIIRKPWATRRALPRPGPQPPRCHPHTSTSPRSSGNGSPGACGFSCCRILSFDEFVQFCDDSTCRPDCAHGGRHDFCNTAGFPTKIDLHDADEVRRLTQTPPPVVFGIHHKGRPAHLTVRSVRTRVRGAHTSVNPCDYPIVPRSADSCV